MVINAFLCLLGMWLTSVLLDLPKGAPSSKKSSDGKMTTFASLLAQGDTILPSLALTGAVPDML
jgi:hypothetical protein